LKDRKTVPALDVPVLETARLRLRGHRRDDFDDLVALWSDPGVTRFIGGKPFNREDIWGRLLRQIGHWALQGYGLWVVEEKEGGAFVGGVGFFDAKREMTPSLDGMPEMGWVLSPRMQGKAYATEAVQAAVHWGDEHFGKIRMCCIIAPENHASIRVAEKAGFRPWRHTTYKDSPTVIFVRDAG
jgi:RimJ/RimL family protein N-acetyltransferase